MEILRLYMLSLESCLGRVLSFRIGHFITMQAKIRTRQVIGQEYIAWIFLYSNF
jgi:hypothetical protein